MRRDELALALSDIQGRISRAAVASGRSSNDVNLIVVTKTYPISDIGILSSLGISDFAENREREGANKSEQLKVEVSANCRWHYQGKIQSNKIKSLLNWVDAIHSLDEVRHVPLIARAIPEGKTVGVFIQVSLDSQPGRGGAQPSELRKLAEVALSTSGLRLMGLMAVAPVGEAPEGAFSRLAQIHTDFKAEFPSAPSLSAGMSGDFEVAIRHGATHVRIGGSILGSRAVQR
ncbi:MAG: YggS family pyridoxal phosphate-dependent enzyme [Actinobacteria bacterium]|nr:YggS family pyridoxal phosphate-dependent enzyme [Actinomycetota bacterium]